VSENDNTVTAQALHKLQRTCKSWEGKPEDESLEMTTENRRIDGADVTWGRLF